MNLLNVLKIITIIVLLQQYPIILTTIQLTIRTILFHNRTIFINVPFSHQKHLLFALFLILTRSEKMKIVRISLLNIMFFSHHFLVPIRHEIVRISLLKQHVYFAL